jgi:integrase
VGKKNKQELMRERDFKKILTKCEGLRELTIVSMFWYTGMRSKELRTMRLCEIDLKQGIIFVAKSKTMTGVRKLPIHPNFKQLLEKYVKRRKQIETTEDTLFLTKRGTPFKERTMVHFINQLQLDLDKYFTCHDFRRAFITRLYRKTNNLVLCQSLAGHASIETTRRYIIDNFEEHQRKFNSLNF